MHHWPIWGNERVVDFLKKQRDVYKYIHDQTVRMANAGMTPREISAELEFPESMQTTFANRGYYGTLSHNAKAVYQFYFGWYDGNPAHLNPLPPLESAARYIAFMGGTDSVLSKAQDSFDKGDYRWTAEVLNHLVFTDLSQSYVLHLENAVMHHKMAPPDARANATLHITQKVFLNMATNTAGVEDFLFSDDIKLSGNKIDLINFFCPAGSTGGKIQYRHTLMGTHASLIKLANIKKRPTHFKFCF